MHQPPSTTQGSELSVNRDTNYQYGEYKVFSYCAVQVAPHPLSAADQKKSVLCLLRVPQAGELRTAISNLEAVTDQLRMLEVRAKLRTEEGCGGCL